MRYLARYVRPKYGPSVGMSNTLIREYASDANAMRYMHKHLQALHFAPGQYLLETFPYHQAEGRVVGHLYKRA